MCVRAKAVAKCSSLEVLILSLICSFLTKAYSFFMLLHKKLTWFQCKCMGNGTLYRNKTYSCLSWFQSDISCISYWFIVPMALFSELGKLLGRNIPGLINGKNIRSVRMNLPCLYELKCFYDFKNMELFFPYESTQLSCKLFAMFFFLSQFSDRMMNHFMECTYLIFQRLVFHLLKELSWFCSANGFFVVIGMHGVLPCMLLNNS